MRLDASLTVGDDRQQTLLTWVGILCGAALALAGSFWLYREAIGLPFFFDDMIHLRWLDWHTLPSVWTTAEGLGYYRPLTMSVWKVGYMLLGRNDPQVMHLGNLLLHALNTALVAYLAWRAYQGSGRVSFAVLSAALFLTFPFSFQAVPSTSSLSKPLIATLSLSSAALYWAARRRRSRWLMGASLVAAFLAPFAYETGVTIPLAIVSIEALGVYRREFERISWLPLLHMVLLWAIALPIVVLLEPETGASLRLPTLLNLWQNFVYFGQGVTYPLAPLGTPLARLVGIDEYVLVAIINVLGFAGLGLVYHWARKFNLFLYGFSWFVVGILPMWAMLDFNYVITSPRLLYLGGAGSALLWAGIPVILWSIRPARWWGRALAVLAAVGMLVFGAGYVRQKMDLAEAVGESIWQAADAAGAAGDHATLLYLNVPAWVAPKEPIYRIGTEGLTFIPDYVRVQDSMYINSGYEPEIRSFMYDPVKQEWQAYIGYAGEGLGPEALVDEIRLVDAAYLTRYTPTGLQFVEAGGLEAGAANGELARFGDLVSLTDLDSTMQGSELTLTLWWLAREAPLGNLTVFLHVYDAAGQLVAQGDGQPLAGLFPVWAWQAGERLRDVRHVSLPDDLPVGKLRVVVGWYDVDSGQRLPVQDLQGQQTGLDSFPVAEFERP